MGEPQTMLHLVPKIVRTRRTIVMMRNILQNPWVEVVELEPEGVVLEGVVEVLVALHVHMVVMMIAMEILLETAKLQQHPEVVVGVEAVVEAEGQLVTSNPRMRVKEHRMIRGLKKICSFQLQEEGDEVGPEVGVEVEELLVVRLIPHLQRKKKVVMTRRMISRRMMLKRIRARHADRVGQVVG